MKRTPNFFAETGRSMLEILAVITIICVFSIGSIIFYNQTNDKQKAKNDYEEMLMAVSSRLNKGTFRTDKGIADTQWNKKKTRRGNQILTEKNCPQNAITVTVDQVSPGVCKELLKKNWNMLQKPLSFYRAAEFGEICSGLPPKIMRDGYYITSEADCERVKPSGEWQTFSVSYPMKADVVARRLCKTNAECYSCESCSDANVCTSTCDSDQYCYSDGTCREYEDCAENEYRDEKGDCQKCPKNAVCADKKTISGCKEGFYLEEGACKSCPTPQGQGCLDDKDANGCPIYERMICRGTTPVCQSDSAAEDYNTCYCPAHAICTSSSGSGSGSSGSDSSGENGEENSEDGFVCEDGYYKSGDTCVECHISGATGCSDEETATSCSENYYLSAASCISCPANATCAGGTDDFVCSDGWEQNEAGTACVAAATECSGHGTKDENDTCVCQGGYTGTDCETQITCVNGTWTENGCDCDDDWYGPLCDSDCDGFKDTGNTCYLCSEPSVVFYTLAEECMRCKSSSYPRRNYEGYCSLTCEGQTVYDFYSGLCKTCQELADSPRHLTRTFEEDCSKCGNKSEMLGEYCVFPYGCEGFLALEEKNTTVSGGAFISKKDYFSCISCSSDEGYIASSEQCDRCNNSSSLREMLTFNEKNYCSLTISACDALYPSGGGFRDIHGSCKACSTESAVETTSDECSRCSDTNYPRFMDNSGKCHLCSTESLVRSTSDECGRCRGTNYTRFYSSSYSYCLPCSCSDGYKTTADECAQCNDSAYPRMMSGNYCVLAPDCFGHGTKTNGTCVCNTGYSGTNCETECSGNGTITNGVCVCNSGWYGPLCDSDCDGIKSKYGSCYDCSSITDTDWVYPTSASECYRCDNTFYHNDNPTEYPDSGYCYPCSTGIEHRATEAECNRCNGVRQMLNDNLCILTDCGSGKVHVGGRCTSCNYYGPWSYDGDFFNEYYLCNNVRATYNVKIFGAISVIRDCGEGNIHRWDGECDNCRDGKPFEVLIPSECTTQCGYTYDSSTNKCV